MSVKTSQITGISNICSTNLACQQKKQTSTHLILWDLFVWWGWGCGIWWIATQRASNAKKVWTMLWRHGGTSPGRHSHIQKPPSCQVCVAIRCQSWQNLYPSFPMCRHWAVTRESSGEYPCSRPYCDPNSWWRGYDGSGWCAGAVIIITNNALT